jgi:hypothetical protein
VLEVDEPTHRVRIDLDPLRSPAMCIIGSTGVSGVNMSWFGSRIGFG